MIGEYPTKAPEGARVVRCSVPGCLLPGYAHGGSGLWYPGPCEHHWHASRPWAIWPLNFFQSSALPTRKD